MTEICLRLRDYNDVHLGYNHRIGLFDRVMLKDNHLAVAGATGGNRLSETVTLAVNTCEDIPVEVEVDRLEQIAPSLEAGADIILLDNFSPPELKEAVSMIDGRAWTEASGGITLDNLPIPAQALGDLGLDYYFNRRTSPPKQSVEGYWPGLAMSKTILNTAKS